MTNAMTRHPCFELSFNPCVFLPCVLHEVFSYRTCSSIREVVKSHQLTSHNEKKICETNRYALKSNNIVQIFGDLSKILRGSNESVHPYRGTDTLDRCDLCRVVTALIVRSIIQFPGSMGQWHAELCEANMLKTLQDIGRCYAISLRSEYGHFALDHIARDAATVLAKSVSEKSVVKKLDATEMIQPTRMLMTDTVLTSSPRHHGQHLKRLRRRRVPDAIDTRLAHSVGKALEIMNVVSAKKSSPSFKRCR